MVVKTKNMVRLRSISDLPDLDLSSTTFLLLLLDLFEEVRFLKRPDTILKELYLRMVDDSRVDIPTKNFDVR